jgi:hypothetical protein
VAIFSQGDRLLDPESPAIFGSLVPIHRTAEGQGTITRLGLDQLDKIIRDSHFPAEIKESGQTWFASSLECHPQDKRRNVARGNLSPFRIVNSTRVLALSHKLEYLRP